MYFQDVNSKNRFIIKQTVCNTDVALSVGIMLFLQGLYFSNLDQNDRFSSSQKQYETISLLYPKHLKSPGLLTKLLKCAECKAGKAVWQCKIVYSVNQGALQNYSVKVNDLNFESLVAFLLKQ